MKNNTNTNSIILNKVYANLIDYVSLIQQNENNEKQSWANQFVAKCEKGESDFALVFKSLKEGLISQFGFEMTHNVILPEIVWSNNLSEFCD